MRKISPSPGFDPVTVQPVASRYTVYAIPAHIDSYCKIKYCFQANTYKHGNQGLWPGVLKSRLPGHPGGSL